MIEGASHHLQPGSGLLIKRPESQIVELQIFQQSLHRPMEKALRGWIGSRDKVVVYSPSRPDKAVQNMSGGRHDVFLEPEVTALIGEGHTTILSWHKKTGEGPLSSVDILGFASFSMRPN